MALSILNCCKIKFPRESDFIASSFSFQYSAACIFLVFPSLQPFLLSFLENHVLGAVPMQGVTISVNLPSLYCMSGVTFLFDYVSYFFTIHMISTADLHHISKLSAGISQKWF
jgi:hypothetical protein